MATDTFEGKWHDATTEALLALVRERVTFSPSLRRAWVESRQPRRIRQREEAQAE